MKTVRDFMLKKFPTNKYIDCPIPKETWPLFQEYASQCLTEQAEKHDAEICEAMEWIDNIGYRQNKNGVWNSFYDSIDKSTAELRTEFRKSKQRWECECVYEHNDGYDSLCVWQCPKCEQAGKEQRGEGK